MTDSRSIGWQPAGWLEVGVADWLVGIVLVAILVASLAYRLVTPHVEYDEFVNETHEVRRQDDISSDEFERRVASTLAPDQRRIRDVLLDAGIDSEAATKVARRFESIEHLRAASHDEIAAPPGVSSETAARIASAADGDEEDGESRAHAPAE